MDVHTRALSTAHCRASHGQRTQAPALGAQQRSTQPSNIMQFTVCLSVCLSTLITIMKTEKQGIQILNNSVLFPYTPVLNDR